MSCNYILKNGNICKNTAKKSIKILDYCTRHYNILIQNSNTTPDNIDNIFQLLPLALPPIRNCILITCHLKVFSRVKTILI